MDARILRGAMIAAAVLVSLGANYRSPNFVVSAPTVEVAEQVGLAAEKYRQELAIEWTGKPMPNWSRPCPISVQVGAHLGAGGVTSFVFDHGEVFGWQMEIQGPLDRLIDSVLPHEVTHTIFASHFRRPLPRWADEGACTTVEHDSERKKQQKLLVQFLQTGRGIAFSQMYVMKEYPRDILPLYAQGHSLSTYLIAQGGKHRFLEYVGEGMDTDDWIATTKKFYGFESLADLQSQWLDWVRRGSPKLEGKERMLAGNGAGGRPVVIRGQSPDGPNGVALAAPLVPVRRGGSDEGAVAVAGASTTRDGWLPAGRLKAMPVSASSPGAVAGVPSPLPLPGPASPAISQQVADPPLVDSPDAPSVYAVRPLEGAPIRR